MTWAIGAGLPFGGYAVVLSDIQVTFGDRTADLLRKAYPVGPFLIGAFAGSVQIGFDLLGSVANFVAVPSDAENVAWHPSYVAEHWGPVARSVYEAADDRQKELGSEFLLAGIDPVEDVIPARARPYVYTFCGPAFEPRVLERSDEALSIGSGAGIDIYRRAVTEALSFRSGILQAEVNNDGGWASTLGFALNRFLEDHPVEGISTHLHIQTAARGRFGISNSNKRVHAGDHVTEVRMPPVAESYEQLVQMVQRIGHDVASAKA